MGPKDETKGVEMWSHACYESPPGVKRLYQHDYYADKAADGTVLGVSSIVQDITQQKLAEVAGVIPWEADTRTWEFSYVGRQAEKRKVERGRALGLHPSTLLHRLKKLGIERPRA